MAGDVTVAVVSEVHEGSASLTTDYVKSGFGTVKACIVLMGFDEDDDTSVASHSRISIGVSDFTGQYSVSHQDETSQAKVDCDAYKSNTGCYLILNSNGTPVIGGTASAITDGVRLTNSGIGSGTNPFATVIMFGGADLAVSLQSSAINSSQDGTATISHAGFTDGNDKLIFFIGTDISGEDSASSGINNSFGVCHATGSDSGGWTLVQRCMGWASDHGNAAGSPASILSTDRVLDIITEGGTQDWGLEVTGYSNSGGTWTVTTRDAGSGAGMEVYSLALDLDDRKAKVGDVNLPGVVGGGTWTPSVSLGFTPQYVGLGLTLSISARDIIRVNNSSAGGLGISSCTGSGEETSHSWYNQDAVGTTNTNNLFRSRAIDLRSDSAAAVRQDLTFASFNSGDWTYTINTTGSFDLFYWTIEEAAAGTTTYTKTATAGALLKKQDLLLTASANALLAKLGIEKTASADALLVKTTELTAQVDALLKALGVERTASADAVLKKFGLTVATAADALLQRSVALTAGADAYLQKTYLKTAASDAILKALGVELTTNADALLKALGLTATTSADAILAERKVLLAQADALLKKSLTRTACGLASVVRTRRPAWVEMCTGIPRRSRVGLGA